MIEKSSITTIWAALGDFFCLLYTVLRQSTLDFPLSYIGKTTHTKPILNICTIFICFKWANPSCYVLGNYASHFWRSGSALFGNCIGRALQATDYYSFHFSGDEVPFIAECHIIHLRILWNYRQKGVLRSRAVWIALETSNVCFWINIYF